MFGGNDREGERTTTRTTTERTTTRTPAESPSTGTTARPTSEEPTERPTDEPTTEASTTEETTTEERTTEEPTSEETSTEEETTEEETAEENTEDEPTDLCSADPRIAERGPLVVDRNSRELRKCAGRPLDAFEDLEPWADVSGSLRATSASFVGTGSLHMATTGDPSLSVRRRFPDRIDLSDRDRSLVIDLKRPENEDIEVRLFAPDAENSITCERVVRSAGWYRLDVGPSETQGSPDLADVRELRIRTYSGSGRFGMSVDSLRTTERADRGAVMLTFDDNDDTQYETAFPITEEFGFPGVVSVIAEGVGDSSRIPLEGMYEMRDAGWEMVSHPQTRTPVPEMTTARKRKVIRESSGEASDEASDMADDDEGDDGLPSCVTIETSGDEVRYAFEIEGEVQAAASDDQTAGSRAASLIRFGKDEYDFAGEFVESRYNGPIETSANGQTAHRDGD